MLRARNHLLTALLIGGLALLAAGWLGLGTGGPGGGRYVEAVVGQPTRVNPLAVHANDAEDDLVALVFSGLMRIGADGQPQPDLAQAWELTADGLTYTFRLRPGLTWHDGVSVTASDVAFTIARLQGPSFQGPPALAGAWADVQVFVSDPATVLIRTPEPAADFLTRAALGLLPAHLAAEMTAPTGFDVAPFDRHPVGTGPYRLVTLDDRHAVLERHARFALGLPAIGRIELRFVADVDAQLAALAAGDADAALLGEQPAAGEQAALARRRDLVETALPRTAYTALYLNNQRAPLDATALRRALAASIDRGAVIAAAGIRGTAGDGVIVPGSWAYQPLDAPASDLDALWREAGWTRGADGRRAQDGKALELELVTNADAPREAMARNVAQQLTAQGVTVNVVALATNRAIVDRLQGGAYQLAIFGWEAGADPDPYPGWHTSQGGGGNVAGFQDPEADALLEAARTTLDGAERRELYGLFQRRFADQAPALVLAYPSRTYVYFTRLRGATWGLLVTAGSHFRDVYRWRLG